MSQRTRVLIAIAAIVILVAIVLGGEMLRRRAVEGDLEPGSVPIYVRGRLVGGFLPTDLEKLAQVSFVDAEEGKTQEGWLLRDVLLLHLAEDAIHDLDITVSSSSRNKSVTLPWSDVADAENMVMFDLANRGTLKLVSKLPGFDTRDTWIQDVDRIDVK